MMTIRDAAFSKRGKSISLRAGFDGLGQPSFEITFEGELPEMFDEFQALHFAKKLEQAVIDILRIRDLVAGGVVDRSVLKSRQLR